MKETEYHKTTEKFEQLSRPLEAENNEKLY